VYGGNIMEKLKLKTKEKLNATVTVPVQHANIAIDTEELEISSLAYSVLDDLLNTIDEDIIITRIDGQLTIIAYDDLIETV
jgi:hypothetical protein